MLSSQAVAGGSEIYRIQATDIRAGSGATRRTWYMRWHSTRRAGCWREPGIAGICTGSTAIILTRGCSTLSRHRSRDCCCAGRPLIRGHGQHRKGARDRAGARAFGDVRERRSGCRRILLLGPHQRGEAGSAGRQGTLFETRSGNVGRAQRNWSAWAPLNQGRVASPPARFLQYRAT